MSEETQRLFRSFLPSEMRPHDDGPIPDGVIEGELALWAQEGGYADPSIDIEGSEESGQLWSLHELIRQYLGVSKPKSGKETAGPVRVEVRQGQIIIAKAGKKGTIYFDRPPAKVGEEWKS